MACATPLDTELHATACRDTFIYDAVNVVCVYMKLVGLHANSFFQSYHRASLVILVRTSALLFARLCSLPPRRAVRRTTPAGPWPTGWGRTSRAPCKSQRGRSC